MSITLLDLQQQQFHRKTAAGPGEQAGVKINGQQTLLLAWRKTDSAFSFHDGGYCHFVIDWTKAHNPSCTFVKFVTCECAGVCMYDYHIAVAIKPYVERFAGVCACAFACSCKGHMTP